jgi:hypothetical protein
MSIQNISPNPSTLQPFNPDKEAFYISQATINSNNNNCRPDDFVDQLHALRDQADALHNEAIRGINSAASLDAAIIIADALSESTREISKEAQEIFLDYQMCKDPSDEDGNSVTSARDGVNHIRTGALHLQGDLYAAKRRQDLGNIAETGANSIRTILTGILVGLGFLLRQDAYGH